MYTWFYCNKPRVHYSYLLFSTPQFFFLGFVNRVLRVYHYRPLLLLSDAD